MQWFCFTLSCQSVIFSVFSDLVENKKPYLCAEEWYELFYQVYSKSSREALRLVYL